MSQQVFLPIDGVHPIPYPFEVDTMPVPRGQFSIFWELENGNVTNAEAIVYLTLNHGSTWASGLSWCMSGPYLSKLLGTGMSRRYVRKNLASLADKGWIQTVETSNPAGYRYQIRQHLCDSDQVPVNYDGKPLTFPVPRGSGGPLERCFDGDIPWKAALVWIVLKLRSEWRAGRDDTGQTARASLLMFSRLCRMKLAGFREMVETLEEKGMLQRVTPKSKRAIFQLYPKPYPRPTRRSSDVSEPTPTPSKAPLEFDGEGYFDDTHLYSRNKRYRCKREDGGMEMRKPGGWKTISDYHRAQEMNPNIIDYFERTLEKQRQLRARVFGDQL